MVEPTGPTTYFLPEGNCLPVTAISHLDLCIPSKKRGAPHLKYLKQFLIIIGITFAGEVLKFIIPLPIPASIYGMAILFTCLMTGRIRPESVKETAGFLIQIMPVMFIPAGVGLITSWDVLGRIFVPVILITVLTNFTVMAATGWVSQIIIRKKGDRNDE